MTIPAGDGVPRGPWPRISFAERTDPGREPQKQENEDSSFYQETRHGHLLVVCDGMGGHALGREASQIAIRTIFEHVNAASPASPPGETLRQAIENAGRAVFTLGGTGHNPTRPGSTCVAVLIHPLGTEVAHIGDSRVYVLRAGQLWPLTRDHSMVQELVDAGLLPKDDAPNHPDANKILKALGMGADTEVELRREIVLQQARDVFLLMTDGVTDVVRDSDLLAIATMAAETGQMPTLCEQVVQLANARGGPDNITIQAAMIVDPGLAPGAVGARAGGPVTQTEDTGGRPTSPGAPSTVRLVPAAALHPTPVGGTDLRASPPPRGGRGGTQKLVAMGGPPPQAPGPPPPAPSGDPRPPRTIVDDSTVDSLPEEISIRSPEPQGRGTRVALGLTMVVVGLALFSLSVRALLFNDEAPPPLVDTAPTTSRPTVPLPSASTAPSR